MLQQFARDAKHLFNNNSYSKLRCKYEILYNKYERIFKFLKQHVREKNCYLMGGIDINKEVANGIAKVKRYWQQKQREKEERKLAPPAKRATTATTTTHSEDEVANNSSADDSDNREHAMDLDREHAMDSDREQAAVDKYIKEQQPEVIKEVEANLNSLWKKHFNTEKTKLHAQLDDFKKDMLVEFNKKLSKMRDTCNAIITKSTTTSSTVNTTLFEATTTTTNSNEQQPPLPQPHAVTDLDRFFSSWCEVEDLFSSPEQVDLQVEWPHLRAKLTDKNIEDHHCHAIANIKTDLPSLPWPLNKNLLPFYKSYSTIKRDEKTKDEVARHYNWFEQAPSLCSEELTKGIFLDWMNHLNTNITKKMWHRLINANNNEPHGWATASIQLVDGKGGKKVFVDEYFLMCFFWWLYPNHVKFVVEHYGSVTVNKRIKTC